MLLYVTRRMLQLIPLLLFISISGIREDGSVLAILAVALTNTAVAIGVIVIVGRLVMRPLFRLVASAGMNELFVATTLFVIVHGPPQTWIGPPWNSLSVIWPRS